MNEPMLGLATTRELLAEISSRMKVTQNSLKGRDLGVLAEEALENLAPGVLNYRTVGPLNRRPEWDTYFLGITTAVAARADCTRAQHGAVIVKDRRIISTGYNGSHPGGPSCLAGECPRGRLTEEEQPRYAPDYSNCIALHAEQNAIARAREQGDTIYITGPPCDMCSKLIKAAGIDRVVHLAPHGLVG